MNVNGFLVNVDLSHNRFRTIDVTYIVWTKQKAFCEVNFSNNMISSINNSLNWACHINSTFGYGGYLIPWKIDALWHRFSGQQTDL